MIGVAILAFLLCDIGSIYFSSEIGAYVKNAKAWRLVFGIGLVLSFVCLLLFAVLEVFGCGI